MARGVPDKHFFVAACCDASPRPVFSRQIFTITQKISFYDKVRARQRFRDCEDITHEPHWLRPHIHRQLDALNEAGCERVFEDRASGAASDRPKLAACLDYLRQGDVLVVLDLDRLGRRASATPFAYRHRASRRLYTNLVSTLGWKAQLR